MAGAGYKLFSTGDVLSASDVNTYLMQQTVMSFANAAARTSALSAVLAEGLVSYLQDTNVVEIYTGAAWVSLDDPNAIQNTLLTTTGDTIYASSANTPARRAIGTSGQVLTVSGGIPVWATPAGGGGKVLQVVMGTYATGTSSSSGTYADTGLTASITPTLNTSKVLVIASQNGCRKSDGNSANALQLRIMRDSTSILTFAGSLLYAPTLQHQMNGANSVAYLDSPATTSATTYKTQFANIAGSAASVSVQANNETSTIILLEIGA